MHGAPTVQTPMRSGAQMWPNDDEPTPARRCVVTTTESHTHNPSHLDLTAQEFERRLAAHGHAADEIHHLWDELAASDRTPVQPPRLVLGLGPVIAVYLGLLLVVAACVSLLVIYWNDLGSWGVLALAIAYLTGYVVASEAMRRRYLIQPADVLEAVAIAWVGLATYAVQELVGFWPEGAGDSGEIHRGLTTIAVVGLGGAVLLLTLRPNPLLLVPIAAATALLALDLAELVFGARIDDLSARQNLSFVFPLGIAWIAVGLWLDLTQRRPFATWAHWCGLMLTGIAVFALIPKTVSGFALVAVLGAIALFFSALVRHWSFTVVGAFGVLIATTASMSELGGIAPLAIAVVGIALILVGLRWSRWRVSIRAAVLAWMPAGARDLVQRLGP
jgi:hypothetical protein